MTPPRTTSRAWRWLPNPVYRWVRKGLDYLPRGQSLSEDVWRVRHRTLSYLLRAHVLGVFVFALARGYTIGSALMYASVVGVFAVLSATDPHRRGFVSAMNAVGLVTSSAVLVDLSGGVIEMHFHFFVMVGILTLYQDWLPVLLAIGFVVLHHGVFGILDPSAVYDHRSAINHPFEWALIHGGFVLAASVASIVAWRLNEEQAFRDALTHLPNRALFSDRLSHALVRAQRHPETVAVLFIDLDGFKDVNDSLGHAAGDQLLVKVAERLRSCLRPADTPARLGGDEFAVLLEDVPTVDDAAKVAGRVLEALSNPFVIGTHETSVGASVGIALSSRMDDPQTLLRNADVAMYSVKAGGGGRFDFYDSEMLNLVVQRVEFGQQLRRACENREFVLHYQPIVEFGSGHIVGVEALVRWNHPTRGLLAPAAFLDVAEENGTILSIGQLVLEQACAQVRHWNSAFPDHPLRVSVNLSSTQVLHARLVDSVVETLTTTGLDPSFLVLEVTEAVLIHDMEVAATRLGRLRNIGVHLAIDDFGSGYSSLSYLRQLPFDVLKIDKAFVDDVVDDGPVSSLTRAIIAMGRSLDMVTVAEGVEHDDQALALKAMGCRFAQGYLYSRPVPAEEITALLLGRSTIEAMAR